MQLEFILQLNILEHNCFNQLKKINGHTGIRTRVIGLGGQGDILATLCAHATLLSPLLLMLTELQDFKEINRLILN